MDPALHLRHLHHTRWTAREGGPAEVNALAQTVDGALWIAATTGLYRFDGIRFDRFAPLPGEPPLLEDISSIFAAPSGELWIGARLGDIHVLRDGHLTSYGASDGLPTGSVLAFAKDQGGHVWAGTTTGLYTQEGARWTRVGAERGFAAMYVSGLLVDGDGVLWAAGIEGTFKLPRGATRFDKVRDGGRGFAVLAPGPDRRPWEAIKQSGLASLPASAPPVESQDLGDAQQPIATFLFDRDGGLWAALGGSLARVPAGRELAGAGRKAALDELQRLQLGKEGPGENIWALLEDREGNIWVGGSGGLDRLRNVRLHPASASQGSLLGAALASAPGGDVWSANERGDRVDLTHDATLRARGPVATAVTSYYIDNDASHWLGGLGALVHASDGAWSTLPAPRNDTVVQALARDGAGALWVSVTRGGLYRWADGVWTPRGGLEGLPEDAPLSLVAAEDGRLWAGFANDRIAVLDGRQVRLLDRSQGLRIGATLAIRVRDEGTWVGGTSGLAFFKGGRFWSVARDDGATITGVSGIVPTAGGELWLNTSAGVMRLSSAEVARFVAEPARPVHVETFDFEDGLEGIAPQLRPLPSAFGGPDGKVWFATNKGVFWIDSRRIARNPLPPGVRILAMKADGIDYRPGRELTLPVATTGFSFDYTAFSLTMSERVRFRYRLEGIDGAWQDAGARRQAYYTNIPPGHYRFRVVAANEDGVWNESGDALSFFLPPAFYQTSWFFSICGLALLALLGALYRLRLRKVAASVASHMDARLQERERIARELHDTLLQGTQGLILSFQGIASQLPPASPLREKIEKTLDRADAAMSEARLRVRNLRGEDLPGDTLHEALGQVAAELALDEGVAFRSLVEGSVRELDRVALFEAFHIGREALLNAFAHAQAASIDLQIVYGLNSLRLRVRDNGRSIPPEIGDAGARPGHWGLVGMRERASRLGARIDIRSQPGTGTQVELTVPASRAYLPKARLAFLARMHTRWRAWTRRIKAGR